MRSFGVRLVSQRAQAADQAAVGDILKGEVGRLGDAMAEHGVRLADLVLASTALDLRMQHIS